MPVTDIGKKEFVAIATRHRMMCLSEMEQRIWKGLR